MQKSRRDILKLLGAAAAPLVVPGVAAAQSYPDRPIRLVVPFPPGGAYDSLGRPWAERIKPLLGSIVVENIGGAGASLGASTVAKARPDGYTILLGGTLPHVNEALLKARPLYDPNKDLDPIMQLAVGSLCFAVHPSVPCQVAGRTRCACQSQSGQGILRSRRRRFDQSPGWRVVQVSRGHSGARPNSLSGRRAGHDGPGRRSDSDGSRWVHGAKPGTSQVRRIAHSGGHGCDAAARRAGSADGGAGRISRHRQRKQPMACSLPPERRSPSSTRSPAHRARCCRRLNTSGS